MKKFLINAWAWILVNVLRFLAFVLPGFREMLDAKTHEALTKAEIRRKLDSGAYELQPRFKLRKLSLSEWDALPEHKQLQIGSERRLVSVFSGHVLRAVNQRKRRQDKIMTEAGVDMSSGRQKKKFRKWFNRTVRSRNRVREKITQAEQRIPELQVTQVARIGPLPTPGLVTDSIRVVA